MIELFFYFFQFLEMSDSGPEVEPNAAPHQDPVTAPITGKWYFFWHLYYRSKFRWVHVLGGIFAKIWMVHNFWTYCTFLCKKESRKTYPGRSIHSIRHFIPTIRSRAHNKNYTLSFLVKLIVLLKMPNDDFFAKMFQKAEHHSRKVITEN